MRMFSGSDGWEDEPATHVYVLEKLWVDGLENRDAHGYSVVGAFIRERDAEVWLRDNQEYWGKDKCWSLYKDTPLYRIVKLKAL